MSANFVIITSTTDEVMLIHVTLTLLSVQWLAWKVWNKVKWKCTAVPHVWESTLEIWHAPEKVYWISSNTHDEAAFSTVAESSLFVVWFEWLTERSVLAPQPLGSYGAAHNWRYRSSLKQRLLHFTASPRQGLQGFHLNCELFPPLSTTSRILHNSESFQF